MLISRNDSCLLIIDVQERLAPAMNDPRKVIDGCARLLKGAALLNVPAIVTEQYPKGLGPTIFDVREAAGESLFFPKTSLSAVQDFLNCRSCDSLRISSSNIIRQNNISPGKAHKRYIIQIIICHLLLFCRQISAF